MKLLNYFQAASKQGREAAYGTGRINKNMVKKNPPLKLWLRDLYNVG